MHVITEKYYFIEKLIHLDMWQSDEYKKFVAYVIELYKFYSIKIFILIKHLSIKIFIWNCRFQKILFMNILWLFCEYLVSLKQNVN